MNHVFLSGIVESMPITVSASDQTLHVRMNLTVSHRTAAGIEKKEQYPISAWRGIATRMVELIRPGAHVSIKGYLSQKQTSEGTLIEVTAEEFQSSVPSNRPVRRTATVASIDNSTLSNQNKLSSATIEQRAVIDSDHMAQ